MDTFAKTRNYLTARKTILEREISTNMLRANDGRASPHSRKDWLDLTEFAKTELMLVNEALAELPEKNIT